MKKQKSKQKITQFTAGWKLRTEKKRGGLNKQTSLIADMSGVFLRLGESEDNKREKKHTNRFDTHTRKESLN